MQDALNLLVKYGHVNDPSRAPDFRAADIPPQKTMRSVRPPFFGDATHIQPGVPGDEVYRQDFARIRLPSMLEQDFEGLPWRDIPDTSGQVLVDIGSHLGRRVTLPFARARPHVSILMVDHLTPDEVADSLNFTDLGDNAHAGEPFRVRVPAQPTVEATVNALLAANGYPNVRYVNKRLAPGDTRIQIPFLGNSRLVVTGFSNPRGLGGLTLEYAVRAGAEIVYLNNAGIEQISPDSAHFSQLRAYLLKHGFTGRAIDKTLSLIHDPDYGHRHEPAPFEKYDSASEGKRLFADVLKLLFVLPQKEFLEQHGYSVQ
ncbi:MAG: hypothetical protein Q7R76_01710, partial [Candidatus Woesearchaeota archaeon]|nr:hypothetical protein [Candidatus Woesearchaeota archaeon]